MSIRTQNGSNGCNMATAIRKIRGGLIQLQAPGHWMQSAKARARVRQKEERAKDRIKARAKAKDGIKAGVKERAIRSGLSAVRAIIATKWATSLVIASTPAKRGP